MKHDLWCLQFALEFAYEITAYYYTLLLYALIRKSLANPTTMQEAGREIIMTYLCRKLYCVHAENIPVEDNYY